MPSHGRKLVQPAFLPMSPAEMERLGWDELDVLIVSGDAYVDHPAFGAALIGRSLVAEGFRVGILAQPDWRNPDSVTAMGRPRLFAGVTAGALDSMLAHYTAFRKKRSDDAYTPGGRAGRRPNRATIVYTSLVKRVFPGLPVILGGIEASLRRAAHYDFWTGRVRGPVLAESKADLLIYGMGEKAAVEAAQRLELARESDPSAAKASLQAIAGTAFMAARDQDPVTPGQPVMELPSCRETMDQPEKLLELSLALELHVHAANAWARQPCGDRNLWIAPPQPPLDTAEIDALYRLPFARRSHPLHRQRIPALDMVQFSIASHRGCGGGCSFCSLALHQGRRVSSRSKRSILGEAEAFTRHPDFKGSVTDVGGPTANMWAADCRGDAARCRRPSCLTPQICKQFKDGQDALTRLLAEIAAIPGIKNVRVASGIRHDLALRNQDYVRNLVEKYTGGQLKLAPEHCSSRVLRLMRKPDFSVFERFVEDFRKISKAAGKDQYIVPYLLSAFPGATDRDMRELADWLAGLGWKPQQVQCFIPTPGTVATAMYHAGVDPAGRKIPVAKTDKERITQHRILVGPLR